MQSPNPYMGEATISNNAESFPHAYILITDQAPSYPPTEYISHRSLAGLSHHSAQGRKFLNLEVYCKPFDVKVGDDFLSGWIPLC